MVHPSMRRLADEPVHTHQVVVGLDNEVGCVRCATDGRLESAQHQ